MTELVSKDSIADFANAIGGPANQYYVVPTKVLTL
jgi:hypothetical protein